VTLVAVLVVLAVIGVVAAVVTGAVRGDLDEPTSNLAPSGLPEGQVTAEDVRAVRFSLGFRGYRMDQVDEVLDHLTVELARRDAELNGLRLARQEEASREEGPGRGSDGEAAADRPADESSADERAPGGPSVDGWPDGERSAETYSGGERRPDAHDRSAGATTARVGPASGTAGWSGPEGG
jgi:DivIVA domain-containing protein